VSNSGCYLIGANHSPQSVEEYGANYCFQLLLKHMAALHPTAFPAPLIGWREDVCLPDLSAELLIAKIDTGAKTAALHAENIRIIGRRVHFTLEFGERRRHFEMALHGTKRIKSSNGISEIRPIIATRVTVGVHNFTTEVALTNRTDMGVPMLLGREAIKGRFIVHPGRSFIISRRKKKLT
jgi:hypothetical protein